MSTISGVMKSMCYPAGNSWVVYRSSWGQQQVIFVVEIPPVCMIQQWNDANWTYSMKNSFGCGVIKSMSYTAATLYQLQLGGAPLSDFSTRLGQLFSWQKFLHSNSTSHPLRKSTQQVTRTVLMRTRDSLVWQAAVFEAPQRQRRAGQTVFEVPQKHFICTGVDADKR